MSLEIVKEVMEAEAQAETLKKEAAAQAKQIALDCQKACSALLEEAKAKARAEKFRAVEEADEQAKSESQAQKAKIAALCETITAAAKAKTSEAVDLVVQRIVRGG